MIRRFLDEQLFFQTISSKIEIMKELLGAAATAPRLGLSADGRHRRRGMSCLPCLSSSRDANPLISCVPREGLTGRRGGGPPCSRQLTHNKMFPPTSFSFHVRARLPVGAECAPYLQLLVSHSSTIMTSGRMRSGSIWTPGPCRSCVTVAQPRSRVALSNVASKTLRSTGFHSRSASN